MPVYAQRSNSGVRGPPSAVRAVLTEPQAEQATHASFPVKPSNTAGDTGRDPKPHALYGEGGREGEADSLNGVTLDMDRTRLIYFISVE